MSLKRSQIKSVNTQELVLVQVEQETWKNEPVKEYLSESSLDEDEPLHKVAQSLSLKRNNSIKYKHKNRNTRNITPKKGNIGDVYRPINLFSTRFNTLPTPPSTPLWVNKVLEKSGSVSSIESMNNSFENLEEKFSVSNMAMFGPVEPLDRATAVAFLKSKSQERLGGIEVSGGKRLERIPTNEI